MYCKEWERVEVSDEKVMVSITIDSCIKGQWLNSKSRQMQTNMHPKHIYPHYGKNHTKETEKLRMKLVNDE